MDRAFSPIQGVHMTRASDELLIYGMFLRTLLRSKPVSRDSCEGDTKQGIYHVYKLSVQMSWVHVHVDAES